MKKDWIAVGISVVLLGGFLVYMSATNSTSSIETENISKTSLETGLIYGFSATDSNFVIETVDAASVEVFVYSAEKEVVSIGQGHLVESYGDKQTWIMSLPDPVMAREIYVTGLDSEGNTMDRFDFPVKGISEIYKVLWTDIPQKITTFSVGQKVEYDGLKIVLNKILEDSRCVTGVVCVQTGRIAVDISVEDVFSGEKGNYTITTNDDEFLAGDYLIKILSVMPEKTIEEISMDEYRVTISIITDSK